LMEDQAQAKILQLLDVISVEVAANRADTAELRDEVRSGFGRVERRLGNLENRVENLEDRVTGLGNEIHAFRGEFERRIAPLGL
jgi:predicted  nucleic acid-binding Zn-ribbon protein